jgi:hypothetical protein
MKRASDQFGEQLRLARERLIRTNISDPALSVCISGMERVERALSRPIRLVILGEYNSGKTSVVDLLIGQGLLPTSVVSNTQLPVLIGHAEEAALFGIDRDGTRIRIDGDADDPLTDLPYRALQIMLPLERLRGYQLLDTPSLTDPTTFVADADIVIWCTVATRAWTESERAAWTDLPKRCSRNAILVATHKDGMQTDEECAQVTQRLRSVTAGMFRDVVLVAADSTHDEAPQDDAWSGAQALRSAIVRAADGIAERRTRKAERIVRRLARLTFHQFASGEVRPEAVRILASWDTHTKALLEQLVQGKKSVPATIQDLLVGYALCAERLRPGVVSGDSIPASGSRALTSPMRWPQQTSAAAHLVEILVSDLTGLLRMLAGTSVYMDPSLKSQYQTVRAIMLSLADLDGAFDALGRMMGSSAVSAQT